MSAHKVISIIGTRPEVIKMAPVIRELDRRKADFDHIVVTTAQHREMLDQVLKVFEIKTDVDLALMQCDQSLSDFAARSLVSLSKLLAELKPDVVLVQGDTTTVMTAALAAFYQNVKVGHVEAGLRSYDRRNPFPEEINRRITGCLADLHFAPTERAQRNLLLEGVPQQSIFVTGNTIVDALRSITINGHFDDERLATIDFERKRVMLVTVHRRENHGPALRSVCKALKELASRFRDVEFVYPVHLNPNVAVPVKEELSGIGGIHLVDPVSYRDLLHLMSRCYLVLTDSGGMQEEAPSFRKPVLVLRETTERPEVVEANAGRIIGTNNSRIVAEVSRLLEDGQEYEAMSTADNPFGDGHAAERIVDVLFRQNRGD